MLNGRVFACHSDYFSNFIFGVLFFNLMLETLVLMMMGGVSVGVYN